MELQQSNTQTPVYSYTRTEFLSLRTKTSLLSLSSADRLKDLNIGYHAVIVQVEVEKGRKKICIHSLLLHLMHNQ